MRAVIGFLARMFALLLLLAFAIYVWPSRFRYDHVSVDGNTYPVRTDRFSGDSDMLVPDQGWTPVEGESGGTPDSNQTSGVKL